MIKTKKHKRKCNNALNQTLKNKVKYFSSYYIKNNMLYIKLDGIELENYNAAYKLRLPEYIDIYNAAQMIYKKFEMDDISNICYVFKKINFNGSVDIEPNFSNVMFESCTIENLNIFGGETITINNCVSFSHENLKINSKKVNLLGSVFKRCDEVKIITDELNVVTSILSAINDININSQFVMLSHTGLTGENICLKFDLIDTKSTILKAINEFKINCKYNEKVPIQDAQKIIYNDIDVTNNDNIKKTRLLRNLINDLKELKYMINETIDKDVEKTTIKRRKNLEGKAIVKVLNKKNT